MEKKKDISTKERSDLGDRTVQKPDPEGKKSGTGSGANEKKEGEQNSNQKNKGEYSLPEKEKASNSVQEESEPMPETDPEKVVSLSCDGELGTYIWGEPADLSGLTVKAVFGDGHEETISDYEVAMNYPELYDPASLRRIIRSSEGQADPHAAKEPGEENTQATCCVLLLTSRRLHQK